MKPDILNNFLAEHDVLEPETLRQLAPELSEEEFNQVLALKVLKHTRHYFENFYAFEDITLALNGVIPDFTLLQGCTPSQIWYAVKVANEVRPGMEYANEVQLYIKYICNSFGVFIYPEVGLDNPYLAKAKELSAVGPFPLGESTEEIQAAKLLEIEAYMKEQEHKAQL